VTGADWYDEYWAKIILPGHHRRCLACSPEPSAERTLECTFCGPLLRSAFSDMQISDMPKKDRRVLCRSCRSPKCTHPDCSTRSQCRNVKCLAPGRCGKTPVPVHSMKVPRTQEEIASFRCDACEGILECTFCGPLPWSAFSDMQISNLSMRDRRVLCRSCRSPKCTHPDCPTCPQCRNVKCLSLGRCGKTPEPEHSMKVPRTQEEIASFRCDACEGILECTSRPLASECVFGHAD